jgi:hypothetical protein
LLSEYEGTVRFDIDSQNKAIQKLSGNAFNFQVYLQGKTNVSLNTVQKQAINLSKSMLGVIGLE